MILSSTSVKLRTNVTRKPRNLRYLYMTSKVKRARACPTCDALYTVTPQTYSRTSPSLRGTNSSFLPERVLYILRPILSSHLTDHCLICKDFLRTGTCEIGQKEIERRYEFCQILR